MRQSFCHSDSRLIGGYIAVKAEDNNGDDVNMAILWARAIGCADTPGLRGYPCGIRRSKDVPWNVFTIYLPGYRLRRYARTTRLSLRDTPRLSVDNPPFYRALVAVEIRTDFDDLFVAGFVWYRVAFVVDLF